MVNAKEGSGLSSRWRRLQGVAEDVDESLRRCGRVSEDTHSNLCLGKFYPAPLVGHRLVIAKQRDCGPHAGANVAKVYEGKEISYRHDNSLIRRSAVEDCRDSTKDVRLGCDTPLRYALFAKRMRIVVRAERADRRRVRGESYLYGAYAAVSSAVADRRERARNRAAGEPRQHRSRIIHDDDCVIAGLDQDWSFDVSAYGTQLPPCIDSGEAEQGRFCARSYRMADMSEAIDGGVNEFDVNRHGRRNIWTDPQVDRVNSGWHPTERTPPAVFAARRDKALDRCGAVEDRHNLSTRAYDGVGPLAAGQAIEGDPQRRIRDVPLFRGRENGRHVAKLSAPRSSRAAPGESNAIASERPTVGEVVDE
jgi:hypothetical protein